MTENDTAIEDLGNAVTETKQQSPLGPFLDSLFGFGWSPG